MRDLKELHLHFDCDSCDSALTVFSKEFSLRKITVFWLLSEGLIMLHACFTQFPFPFVIEKASNNLFENDSSLCSDVEICDKCCSHWFMYHNNL